VTLPKPAAFDSNGNRPVPRHGIQIALHLSLLAACACWLLTFISDKQWHEHHPGAGVSGIPVPLWISILWVALPFVLYVISVLLLSTRSEELIAAGAGIAAGISPFSLLLAVSVFLGATFFSFFPIPYFIAMAISLLALFGSSVWIIVSAFRIGKVNWGMFFLAAFLTFVCLAICVAKGMSP
jgi:hypothetical protein